MCTAPTYHDHQTERARSLRAERETEAQLAVLERGAGHAGGQGAIADP